VQEYPRQNPTGWKGPTLLKNNKTRKAGVRSRGRRRESGDVYSKSLHHQMI
jgi:hypothetical protein